MAAVQEFNDVTIFFPQRSLDEIIRVKICKFIQFCTKPIGIQCVLSGIQFYKQYFVSKFYKVSYPIYYCREPNLGKVFPTMYINSYPIPNLCSRIKIKNTLLWFLSAFQIDCINYRISYYVNRILRVSLPDQIILVELGRGKKILGTSGTYPRIYLLRIWFLPS